MDHSQYLTCRILLAEPASDGKVMTTLHTPQDSVTETNILKILPINKKKALNYAFINPDSNVQNSSRNTYNFNKSRVLNDKTNIQNPHTNRQIQEAGM